MAKEREILPYNHDQEEAAEAERLQILDRLDATDFGSGLCEAVQLMDLGFKSELETYQCWTKATSIQHDVFAEGSYAQVEQLLCAYQGSWEQVLLLSTYKGAKVGRFMLAAHKATTGIRDGKHDVLPIMGIEQDLFSFRDGKEIPARAWTRSHSRKNLSAGDLVRAATGPLMAAIEVMTGPLDCPSRDEDDALDLLSTRMRTVVHPNNRGSISRFLAEYLFSVHEASNQLQKFISVRTQRTRDE